MSKNSGEENQALIAAKMQNVQEAFSQGDVLNRYVLQSLDGFAYRYFDQSMKAELLSPQEMRVMAIEAGIKEAIKIKNETLRKGIGELVERVSREEGPTMARELRVHIPKREPGKGVRLMSTPVSAGDTQLTIFHRELT